MLSPHFSLLDDALAFKSLSHGTVAFGFFNIESDLLLLDRRFFFAADFATSSQRWLARAWRKSCGRPMSLIGPRTSATSWEPLMESGTPVSSVRSTGGFRFRTIPQGSSRSGRWKTRNLLIEIICIIRSPRSTVALWEQRRDSDRRLSLQPAGVSRTPGIRLARWIPALAERRSACIRAAHGAGRAGEFQRRFRRGFFYTLNPTNLWRKVTMITAGIDCGAKTPRPSF